MKIKYLHLLISVVLSASAVGYADEQRFPGLTPLDLGIGVDWPYNGHSLLNTHSTSSDSNISKYSVSSLAPNWIYTLDTMSGVSATPSVVHNVVYFPDWGGNLQAVNAANGKLIWKKSFLNDYSRPGKQVLLSRTTPVYNNGVLYIGSNFNTTTPTNGAVMLAIDAKTGDLIWSTLIDTTSQFSVVTQSATVYNGLVYIGTSSAEEGTTCAATNTCSFRGSVVALNASDGSIKWQTYTTIPGFTGASVWGGQPTLDLHRKLLYVGTGNNYTAPVNLPDAPGNNIDSIVAMDMDSGVVKWVSKLTPNNEPDIWTLLCFFQPSASCGPDYDFGQSPMLINTKINGVDQDILVNGQKSGIFFGLKPDDGTVLWATPVGPGSSLGGMEWGSATDGKYIYATDTNFFQIPYVLVNPAPGSLTSTTGGFWSALDPANGHIVWQSAEPNRNIVPAGVAVANHVLFGASASSSGANSGAFFAFDADTGKILFKYDTQVDATHTGSVFASPAIVNGKVYWGSGYPRIITNGSGNKFYSLSIKGR